VYLIKTTNAFEKDVSKMQKRGKDLLKLQFVIRTLADGKLLPNRFRNHKLTGNYKDLSECHVEPDWLLIYEIKNNILYLVRTGTHSDLF
jgi:mRNA interferase YafQ